MKLPKFLTTVFWDVSPRTIDSKKNKDYIITRIAEKGSLHSVKWLRKKYGVKTIKTAIKKSKNISSKTKNFWHII